MCQGDGSPRVYDPLLQAARLAPARQSLFGRLSPLWPGGSEAVDLHRRRPGRWLRATGYQSYSRSAIAVNVMNLLEDELPCPLHYPGPLPRISPRKRRETPTRWRGVSPSMASFVMKVESLRASRPFGNGTPRHARSITTRSSHSVPLRGTGRRSSSEGCPVISRTVPSAWNMSSFSKATKSQPSRFAESQDSVRNARQRQAPL